MSGVNNAGALSDRLISEMTEAGHIEGAQSANIRPASLDLTISDEIYEVSGVFQPRPNEKVRQILKKVKKARHSMNDPLKRNRTYLARLNERMILPRSVYAYCNPKSTSGRLDIHIRLLADGVPRYDTLASGWPAGRDIRGGSDQVGNTLDQPGELWVSIITKTFPVKLQPGTALNQMRFFDGDTRFDDTELEIAMKKDRLLWSRGGKESLDFSKLPVKDNDGSLVLGLDCRSSITGFCGRSVNSVLDLSRVDGYDPDKFFTPIEKQNDNIVLQKDKFYILSSREAVRVPPHLACEMMPMDERSGEFRSHYAGFIDPGWGWGADGEGCGRPLTLEVRPFEDLVVRDGQPIAKIRFERVRETPQEHYDTLNSNYCRQKGPKLAKQFRTNAG